jgi:hypothetical protein
LCPYLSAGRHVGALAGQKTFQIAPNGLDEWNDGGMGTVLTNLFHIIPLIRYSEQILKINERSFSCQVISSYFWRGSKIWKIYVIIFWNPCLRQAGM